MWWSDEILSLYPPSVVPRSHNAPQAHAHARKTKKKVSTLKDSSAVLQNPTQTKTTQTTKKTAELNRALLLQTHVLLLKYWSLIEFISFLLATNRD